VSAVASAADAPLLRLEEVAVGFGSAHDVLAAISLEIRAGEFVTLLGPSGCGKSTLLNLTAGTLRPRRGGVVFDGRPVSSINRGVGYVTQEDTMLPLRMRRVARNEIHDRVSGLLRRFGLDHAAHLYPSQLSGGMKKRGLFARALIYQPRLLLMDEPFAALDAQMRSQLQVEFRRVVRETGSAALFVTHDIEEAALVSDRVVVLGGGPPARVIDEIRIDLGAERDAETLRFDAAFREVGRSLQTALRRAKGELH
jgi:NitT/TauT family transport system ATP-binding protein